MAKSEMEMVQEAQDIKDMNEAWQNAKSISEMRNAKRRALRASLNVVVKHNTPIEQVCMSATLLRLIDDVFSTTQANSIMARLGSCEAVKISNNENLAKDIYNLYLSAKRSYENKTLTLADVCELTEKGVKMDKYAFSFYVSQ